MESSKADNKRIHIGRNCEFDRSVGSRFAFRSISILALPAFQSFGAETFVEISIAVEDEVENRGLCRVFVSRLF